MRSSWETRKEGKQSGGATWGETTLTALGFDRGTEGWVGVHVDNLGAGLVRLEGVLDGEAATFTAQGSRRESWRRTSSSTYRWEREVWEGGSWERVLTIEFSKTG